MYWDATWIIRHSKVCVLPAWWSSLLWLPSCQLQFHSVGSKDVCMFIFELSWKALLFNYRNEGVSSLEWCEFHSCSASQQGHPSYYAARNITFNRSCFFWRARGIVLQYSNHVLTRNFQTTTECSLKKIVTYLFAFMSFSRCAVENSQANWQIDKVEI